MLCYQSLHFNGHCQIFFPFNAVMQDGHWSHLSKSGKVCFNVDTFVLILCDTPGQKF